MSEPESRPRIFVIAQMPEPLVRALSQDNQLIPKVLEGQNPAQPLVALPECEAVLTRAVFGIPRPILDAMPNLKLVVSLGVGVEKFDQQELRRRGITLLHTPDELTEDVADYAVGLVYAAQRNIVAADRFVRKGAWSLARFGYSRRVSCRHA